MFSPVKNLNIFSIPIYLKKYYTMTYIRKIEIYPNWKLENDNNNIAKIGIKVLYRVKEIIKRTWLFEHNKKVRFL